MPNALQTQTEPVIALARATRALMIAIGVAAFSAFLTAGYAFALDPSGNYIGLETREGVISHGPPPLPTPTSALIDLAIGVVTPGPDNRATIDVTLMGEGAAGVRLDLYVDDRFMRTIACEINPAIGTTPFGTGPENVTCRQDDTIGPCKTLGLGIFDCGSLPTAQACPLPPNPDLTIVRASVAGNTSATIPAGRLFTCTFQVLRTGDFGRFDFDAGFIFVTDSEGTPLEVQFHLGGVLPQATPSPTASPGPINLALDSQRAGRSRVTVSLVLQSGNATTGGVESDLIFDNTVLDLVESDCRINPAIGVSPLGPPDDFVTCFEDTTIGPCKTLSKRLVRCADEPGNIFCPLDAGPEVSVLHAFVAATGAPNVNPIPDGIIYTCTFTVLDSKRLPTFIDNVQALGSDPVGNRLEANAMGIWIERDLTSTSMPTAHSGNGDGCQLGGHTGESPAFVWIVMAILLLLLGGERDGRRGCAGRQARRTFVTS